MLSLSNTYSADEIRAFDERVRKFLQTEDDIDYFCEPKFDGLAIELVYEHGVLTGALEKSRADSSWTSLVMDMGFIFIAEIPDGAQDGVGSGLAQAAEG